MNMSNFTSVPNHSDSGDVASSGSTDNRNEANQKKQANARGEEIANNTRQNGTMNEINMIITISSRIII